MTKDYDPDKLGGFLMEKFILLKQRCFDSTVMEFLWCRIQIDAQTKGFQIQSYLQMWLLFLPPALRKEGNKIRNLSSKNLTGRVGLVTYNDI